MIKKKLQDDLAAYLKQNERARIDVVRFALSLIQNEEIKQAKDKRGELSDEEVVSLLRTEIKRRREAVELFRRGNRHDLVKKEEEALMYLREYLPAELEPSRVREEVRRLSAEFHDFPTLMKAIMAEFKGKADGKIVSEIVREILNEK